MHANRSVLGRCLSVAFVLGLLMSLSVTVASAHEHREVGEFTMVVGFRMEPALVDEPNGLDLRVERGHGDAAEPVEGLAQTLQAEIMYGGETMPLTIRGVFNAPGRYTADVIPTSTGTYTFRVFGTIEGTEIDESFTGGPDTFSEVAAKTPISFPAPEADGASGSAADAQDTADTAQMLGIVAIVIGVLGLGAGLAALMMARGSRTQTAGD